MEPLLSQQGEQLIIIFSAECFMYVYKYKISNFSEGTFNKLVAKVAFRRHLLNKIVKGGYDNFTIYSFEMFGSFPLHMNYINSFQKQS